MRHFGSVLAVACGHLLRLSLIFRPRPPKPKSPSATLESVLGRRRCTSPKNRESSGSTAWMRTSCSSRRADARGEPGFRGNGSRLHRRHVGARRRRARYLSPNSFLHIEHAYPFDDGPSEYQTGRGVARQALGIQNMGSSTWMHTMLALEYVGLEPKRDAINILSIGDSVLIGQALEAGRVDAAVLDGALVRRLRSRGFSTIAELQPARIPMLNQAVVVHPDFLQKRSETRRKY